MFEDFRSFVLLRTSSLSLKFRNWTNTGRHPLISGPVVNRETYKEFLFFPINYFRNCYFLQLDLSTYSKIELEKVVDPLNYRGRNLWSKIWDEAVKQEIVFAEIIIDLSPYTNIDWDGQNFYNPSNSPGNLYFKKQIFSLNILEVNCAWSFEDAVGNNYCPV